MGTGSFPGVQAARTWSTPHPLLVPKILEKSRAIRLLTLRAFVAYKKGENIPNNIVFECINEWFKANLL
jgi:hypothetical protein